MILNNQEQKFIKLLEYLYLKSNTILDDRVRKINNYKYKVKNTFHTNDRAINQCDEIIFILDFKSKLISCDAICIHPHSKSEYGKISKELDYNTFINNQCAYLLTLCRNKIHDEIIENKAQRLNKIINDKIQEITK